MLLTELLSRFLEDRSRRCVPRIVEWYRSHLELFVAWLFEHEVVALEFVTREHVDRYVADLRARDCMNRKGKLSPVTIQKRMTALKTLFAWADHEGFLKLNPCAALVIPTRGKRLPKALSPDQLSRLITVEMSPREKAIVFLFLDSGLRVSELAGLEFADVDMARGLARVRHGKGDKERIVVFGSQTRTALEAWIVERSRLNGHLSSLFIGERGRLRSMGVYKLIKRVGARAGLGDVVAPHVLRHSFATEYLNGGGSLFNLKELMGHTDIRTTTIYLSVSVERLRSEHERLSPINRLQTG